MESLAALISLNILNIIIFKLLSNLFDLYFLSMNDPIIAFPELVSSGSFFFSKSLDIP